MMTDTSAGIGARYPVWALLALWTLLFMLPFLGLRPLWLPDEARYTEVAREMLTTGDWLTPQLNGHPHLTKPPLTYWAIAGSMAVWGQNEFAARLPNALAFCGIILVTYFLALELKFRRAALWAGIILLTSPVPVIGANVITTDTLLTLWIVLAVYFAWKWYHHRPRGRMYLYAAYAAIGLTLLTKGPAGPLVLVLAFGGLVAYTGSWKIVREAISGWGICMLLLIAAPWYVLIALKHEGLLQYYLSYEMAGRVFTTEHHRNNTFLMYPVELIVGIVPWTIFLFAALRRKFGWTAFRTRRLSAADVFLLSWLVLPLVAFCMAKSRLPLYILSLFIPLLIAVASYLFPERSAAEPADPTTWWEKKLPVVLAIVTSIVLFGARIGAAWFPSPQDISPIARTIVATAGAGDYRVYSNRDNLYTLNFYLKRPVIVTNRLGSFLNDPSPAFAVLAGSPLRQEASADFAKKAKLIFSYYEYRVYYRQPDDAAKRAERLASGL